MCVAKVSRKREEKEEARIKRHRKRLLVIQTALVGSIILFFGWLYAYILYRGILWLYLTSIATLAIVIYPSIYYLIRYVGRVTELNSRHNRSGAAPLVDGGGINALYVQGNWLDRWEREKQEKKGGGN